MPLPPKITKYYEKDAVELTLEDVIKNSEGMPGPRPEQPGKDCCAGTVEA